MLILNLHVRTFQEKDKRKAELIELNEELVESALAVMRSAIANQIDWKEINALLKEAQDRGDPVATRITKLKLDMNHFTMLLSDPYAYLDEDDDEDDEESEVKVSPQKLFANSIVLFKNSYLGQRNGGRNRPGPLGASQRKEGLPH